MWVIRDCRILPGVVVFCGCTTNHQQLAAPNSTGSFLTVLPVGLWASSLTRAQNQAFIWKLCGRVHQQARTATSRNQFLRGMAGYP